MKEKNWSKFIEGILQELQQELESFSKLYNQLKQYLSRTRSRTIHLSTSPLLNPQTALQFLINNKIFSIALFLVNQIIIQMPKLLGLHFTNFGELLIILIQVICYSNTFYTLIFLLGPRPFPVIFLITLIFSRSILAFYNANSTHKQTNPTEESSSYCKSCKCSIQNRDHHCVFIGRCVEKANYKYFLSYVFYSYLLSAALVTSLALDYDLIKQIFMLKVYKFVPFFAIAILSSIYFVIFTGGLLSGCFRSIILGVYTVEELKKKKTIRYTNNELRALWFSSKGREIIKRQFKKNWTTMVGQVSWKQIIFVI